MTKSVIKRPKKALRIAWLGPVPVDRTGVAGVSTLLIGHLASLGHHIDCYFPDAEGPLPLRVAEQRTVNIVWAGTRWTWNRWYSKRPTGALVTGLAARALGFRRLRREMARRHAAVPYDIIYQFSNIEVVGVPRGIRRSVPLVIHPETHVAGELRWYRNEAHLARVCEDRQRRPFVIAILTLRTAIQHITIRWAAAVVCISEVFRDDLIRDYGIDRARTIIVANPIDAEIFDAFERRVGDPPIVLALGRVSVRKGVDQVIELSHRLADAGTNVVIRLVGGHTLWSDYRPLLARANQTNTTYVGPISAYEVAAELAAADVLLQASKYEPFGLTVGEALASGVPVVATVAVGAVEGTSRRTTEVVPIEDVDALVTAVEAVLSRLSADPIEVRKAARADAVRLFDPATIAERLSSFLVSLSSGSDGGCLSEGHPASGARHKSTAAADWTIDVVVPSYRRPHLLEQCLSALAAQSVQAGRIVVVARSDDRKTIDVIERWHGSRSQQIVGVHVDEPGVIAAMTAGVAATSSDIIAFTDDDAAPRPEWISGLLRHFEDRSVGGVGGRDVVVGQDGPLTRDVGHFTWYGKLVGNHHLGCGSTRSVDVLKGVNMAFRAEALALPRARVLKGSGAQVHFEVLVSGYARRGGWRLLYDPTILVDHEIGIRAGVDARRKPRPSAVLDAAFNSSLAAAALSNCRIGRRTLYGLFVGSRAEPGLGRCAAALIRMEGNVLRNAPSGIFGHALGVARLLRGFEFETSMVTATEIRAGRSLTAVCRTNLGGIAE